MKKFCALIAVAVAVTFGASTNASAQPNPVIIDTSSQVVQGTVVYDTWGGHCWTNYGRVISYGVPCQPVYTTYYYPCSTVQYYYPTTCSNVYYYQPCCHTVRRSWCRGGW